MRSAVYNSAIPHLIWNPVKRTALSAFCFSLLPISFLTVMLAITAHAFDWNTPEQQLARKVVAVTGPGAVALTVENRSSLNLRDREIIQAGLHSVLEGVGLRLVKPEQAAATITISLSETPASYVWVAEIRQGESETAVVMVSTARPESAVAAGDSTPLSLRKISLWEQDEPILDVAVLEENPAPAHIAVLDPEKVSLYRLQAGKWQKEQALEIVHNRPWPRDLRGRLIPGRDHLLDVYLPGVVCHSSAVMPLALNCRESDDPWPLVTGMANGAMGVFPSAGLANGASTVVPQLGAFFAPTRNFFTGALTPGLGKVATMAKFYSAAPLPREKYTLWLFATTDGRVHLVDGVSDQAARLNWGSSLASVKTPCGAGWQILATGSGDQTSDSVRAYEFPDRDPVAVSAALDVHGEITALWTEAAGDTAIVVVRDQDSGSYEAFRVALVCNQ
jgi:hypothetical protein